jgi:N-acyl-D-aspartate/D-glutamate deacylase
LKAKSWKKKIINAMEDVGTYKPSFDAVVDILADILERRDVLIESMKGEEMTIEYTNKGGATNLVTHPAVKILLELNKEALAYWRDLGLTPKGLKAISDESLSGQQIDSFEAFIAKVEG